MPINIFILNKHIKLFLYISNKYHQDKYTLICNIIIINLLFMNNNNNIR